MNNILRAVVSIVGTRPLLQHHFGPDAIPLERQERTGVAGNDPVEWRRSCLVTPEGQLYLPGAYFFGCLRDGAKHVKQGRGSLQSAVAATLQVTDESVLLDRWLPGCAGGHSCDLLTIEVPTAGETYVDVRGVVNPGTRGRNIRYRLATAAGWRAEFNILWNVVIVQRDHMRLVCENAGSLCGLGSGRAIGYGRFEVVSFQVRE